MFWEPPTSIYTVAPLPSVPVDWAGFNWFLLYIFLQVLFRMNTNNVLQIPILSCDMLCAHLVKKHATWKQVMLFLDEVSNYVHPMPVPWNHTRQWHAIQFKNWRWCVCNQLEHGPTTSIVKRVIFTSWLWNLLRGVPLTVK